MTTVHTPHEGVARLNVSDSSHPGTLVPACTKAQLLASVCEQTGQQPEEIDQAKLVSDHKLVTSFTCPILLLDCSKVRVLKIFVMWMLSCPSNDVDVCSLRLICACGGFPIHLPIRL